MKKLVSVGFAVVAAFLFALALPSQAQQLVAGRDYTVIDPAIPKDEPEKIEVVEFFSYACPHCNELNPSLMKWAGKLPADVTLRRVPVNFSPFYQLMGRLYYTLEAIGELQRLDSAAFEAIHSKGLRLVDEKSIQDWVVSQGVDAKKFSDAFNSFGVVSKLKRADALAQSAMIRGVPALVVDGRYIAGPNAKGHDELLALTDKVIDKARAERGTAKKPVPAGKAVGAAGQGARKK